MGAEQVFAWTVLFPNFFDLAVPIVGTPQVTSFDLLSKQIVIDAIESDPGYQGGHYTTQPQLKLANAIGAQMVTAPSYRNAEVPRASFPAWLHTIEAPQRQDANDRVWQLKAIMMHDVLHGRDRAGDSSQVSGSGCSGGSNGDAATCARVGWRHLGRDLCIAWLLRPPDHEVRFSSRLRAGREIPGSRSGKQAMASTLI
jgi:homoserine acetyltransferase